MKAAEREKIQMDYLRDVFKKSWTWERLTEEERKRFEERYLWIKIYGNTEQQVYEQINEYYYMFLLGCGYSAIGWREPDNNYPKF